MYFLEIDNILYVTIWVVVEGHTHIYIPYSELAYTQTHIRSLSKLLCSFPFSNASPTQSGMYRVIHCKFKWEENFWNQFPRSIGFFLCVCLFVRFFWLYIFKRREARVVFQFIIIFGYHVLYFLSLHQM